MEPEGRAAARAPVGAEVRIAAEVYGKPVRPRGVAGGGGYRRRWARNRQERNGWSGSAEAAEWRKGRRPSTGADRLRRRQRDWFRLVGLAVARWRRYRRRSGSGGGGGTAEAAEPEAEGLAVVLDPAEVAEV